jgi:hypothetical protein
MNRGKAKLHAYNRPGVCKTRWRAIDNFLVIQYHTKRNNRVVRELKVSGRLTLSKGLEAGFTAKYIFYIFEQVQ